MTFLSQCTFLMLAKSPLIPILSTCHLPYKYGGYMELSIFVKLYNFKIMIYKDSDFQQTIYEEGAEDLPLLLLQYVSAANSNGCHYNTFSSEIMDNENYDINKNELKLETSNSIFDPTPDEIHQSRFLIVNEISKLDLNQYPTNRNQKNNYIIFNDKFQRCMEDYSIQ